MIWKPACAKLAIPTTSNRRAVAMKEPEYAIDGVGFIPMSQRSPVDLRAIASAYRTDFTPSDGGILDPDFDRRYAAILLRERGL